MRVRTASGVLNKLQSDRLAKEVPWVPDFRRELAASLNNRGIQLQTENRLADADPIYQRAVDLLRRVLHHPLA